MILLTDKQKAEYEGFIKFVANCVEPFAADWDRQGALSEEIKKSCSEAGFLGAMIPIEFGGADWDCVTYGLFNQAIGRYSISLSSLFNVQTMVARTLVKWGDKSQRMRWLPGMANGAILASFALTEPDAGSDSGAINAKFTPDGHGFLLNGCKQWITMANIADIFLVFGKSAGKPMAAIVERKTPGCVITPAPEMLGFKAAHLGMIEFSDCRIPRENIIGKPGFALNLLAPYALDFGRISVTWASLGILKGSAHLCGNHSINRKTFKTPLIKHGAIQRLITQLGTDYEAAKLLAYQACMAKDKADADAGMKIMMAKYFTTRAAARHTPNAVQILGARGCKENSLLARYYRDVKIMEIIEGSTQIHEMILGEYMAIKSKKDHGNPL